MPAVLDLMRLVEISHELLLLAGRGAPTKRLGLLALDLLLARGAASRLARQAPGSAAARARHALAFIGRLEEQVVRLYAVHQATHRAPRGVGFGVGMAPVRR
ncbi:MAG: hypothetical protein ACE5LS_02510 [Thermoplasmata archaeon]